MNKEELEKKIKQLQDDIDCLTLACENYREEMEKNLADATELEKENAKLREFINSEHEIETRKNNRLISQLTKAKEIIRESLFHPWRKQTLMELKPQR